MMVRSFVNHHGISPFCIVCNSIGHLKSECLNNPVSWINYVKSLKATGIPRGLFEPLESSVSTPNHSAAFAGHSSFVASTPASSDAALRAFIELVQNALVTLLLLDNSAGNQDEVENIEIDKQEEREILIDPTPVPVCGGGRGRPLLFKCPEAKVVAVDKIRFIITILFILPTPL